MNPFLYARNPYHENPFSVLNLQNAAARIAQPVIRIRPDCIFQVSANVSGSWQDARSVTVHVTGARDRWGGRHVR